MSSSAVIIKQRHYMKAFRLAGATDPARAKGLAEMGLRTGRVFQRMQDEDVFRPGLAPETYYLDESAAEEFVAARRRRALYLFVLIIVVEGLFFILSGRSSPASSPQSEGPRSGTAPLSSKAQF